MSRADIQSKIEVLEKALAEGVTSVRYGDKQLTYNTPEALERAISYFKKQLKKSKGPRRTVVYTDTKKAL